MKKQLVFIVLCMLTALLFINGETFYENPPSYPFTPSIHVDIGEQAINTFIREHFFREFSLGGKLVSIPEDSLLKKATIFKEAIEFGEGEHQFRITLIDFSFDFEDEKADLQLHIKVDYEYDGALGIYKKTRPVLYSTVFDADDFVFDIGTKKIKTALTEVQIEQITGFDGAVTVTGDDTAHIQFLLNQPLPSLEIGNIISWKGNNIEFHNAKIAGGAIDKQILHLGITGVRYVKGSISDIDELPDGILTKNKRSLASLFKDEYKDFPDEIITLLSEKFTEIELVSYQMISDFIAGLPVGDFFDLSKEVSEQFEAYANKQNQLVQAQLEALRKYIESGVYKHGAANQVLDPDAIAKIDSIFETAHDYNTKNFEWFMKYYTINTDKFFNMEPQLKEILNQKTEDLISFSQEQTADFKQWIEDKGYKSLPSRIIMRIEEFFQTADDFTSANMILFYSWLNELENPQVHDDIALFWQDYNTKFTFQVEDDRLRMSITPGLRVEKPHAEFWIRKVSSTAYEIKILANAGYFIPKFLLVSGGGAKEYALIKNVQLERSGDNAYDRYVYQTVYDVGIDLATQLLRMKLSLFNPNQLIYATRLFMPPEFSGWEIYVLDLQL